MMASLNWKSWIFISNDSSARGSWRAIVLFNKGVNLPGTSLDIPGFTEKDNSDLEFGLKNGIDAVAISFVRTADDIAVKDFIHATIPNGRRFPSSPNLNYLKQSRIWKVFWMLLMA